MQHRRSMRWAHCVVHLPFLLARSFENSLVILFFFVAPEFLWSCLVWIVVLYTYRVRVSVCISFIISFIRLLSRRNTILHSLALPTVIRLSDDPADGCYMVGCRVFGMRILVTRGSMCRRIVYPVSVLTTLITRILGPRDGQLRL